MNADNIVAVHKAKEVALEYNPDTVIPFPFGKIAERNGDVEILYDNSSSDKLSGAIIYDKESCKYKILVNTSESIQRQYFTLAHEFGHYFLHRDFLEQDRNVFMDSPSNYEGVLFRATGYKSDPGMEHEANVFAAELLMPEDKVREAWEITRGEMGTDYYADMFKVSVSAMAIRLERLGLGRHQNG